MVFSAFVAAVKCRHVLHHCIVIFIFSSWIMDCMLFTFKYSAHGLRGVSGGTSFITIDEQLQ